VDPKTRRAMGLGLIAGLALGGCGGGPGGEAADEGTRESTGEAHVESAAVADGGTPAGETGDGPPAGAEASGRRDAPAEAGTEAHDTAASEDTVHLGRYFVRLRTAADPDSVAARHGIDPIEVIREPTRAFYASLTRGQHRALEADSMVESLAVELNDVPDRLRGRIQGVETPPRKGGGG